jgi:hypothetical protein
VLAVPLGSRHLHCCRLIGTIDRVLATVCAKRKQERLLESLMRTESHFILDNCGAFSFSLPG